MKFIGRVNKNKKYRAKSIILVSMLCIYIVCMHMIRDCGTNCKETNVPNLFFVDTEAVETDSNSEWKRLANMPAQLVAHNLSTCLYRNGTNRDANFPYDRILSVPTFSRRITCFCLEESPVDNLNCVLRLRSVAVYKSPAGHINEIYMENAPVDFRVRAENSRVIWSDAKLYINGRRGCSNVIDRHCQINMNRHMSYPYVEPFNLTSNPVMLISTLTLQGNHYHSLMGPSGVLQITQTRDAINKFYYEHNNSPDVKQPRLAPSNHVTKYRFHSASPRVSIARHGSCSAMNFTSHARERSNTQTLPPSYLSPEILFAFDNSAIRTGPNAPFSWFGQRLGFCNQEMPLSAYTLVDDLWVNLLYGQMGTHYAMRLGPVPNHELLDGVTFAEEYLLVCPVSDEEKVSSRLAADQLTTVLDSSAKESTLEEGKGCLDVSRLQNGVKEHFCVMTVGRKIYHDVESLRTRGLPENLEKVILDAILMPLDHLEPLQHTVAKKSPLLGLNKIDLLNSCLVDRSAPATSIKVIEKSLSVKVSTATEALELLNHQSGLPPCSTTSTLPPFYYSGLTFSNHSLNFPSQKLKRSKKLGQRSLPEQFRLIWETNLFIMEEGAAATWSLNAKYGSTFVIVYGSNFVRNKDKQSGNFRYQPTTRFFIHSPDLFGKVRMIFFVYQYGRLPSFAKLREAFDRPFKAESIIVACECNVTRVLPWYEGKPDC